ncbi:MAG: hypothetical protein ABSE62_11935 [Chthoniobacteraceae bacterium]|jgi:hypothetical protein
MKAFLLRMAGLDPRQLERVSGMSLQLRNPEALGWLVFCAMLCGLYAWWSYSMQDAHRSLAPWRRYGLIGLRAALLGLILLMFLRPVLALDLQERIRRTLILLVDATKSMNFRDQRLDDADLKRAEIGLGVIKTMSQPLDPTRLADAKQISRADLAKAVLQNQNLNLLDGLKRNFNVETFLFGRAPASVEGPWWLLDYRPSADATAIGDSVTAALDRERGQPLAGIVLVTDGGNNTGSPPEDAAAEARREGVPIYAYGVGITSPRDIIVSHISAPAIAFAKDAVTATVQLRGQGLAGQSGHLSLKLGNDEVASEDVLFTGADQFVPMTFTPQASGDYILTAAIPPRDDETSRDNNSARQFMRVIDSKIKVLYIEQAPRWEFRFLQQVLLRDPRIQPSFVLVEADPGIARETGSPYLDQFPQDKQSLLKYDIVIIGDVDPRLFTADQLSALDGYVSTFGGACLFIAGRNFMPDAWRGSVIEKMLPVELDPPGGDQSENLPIHLELTPLGRSSEMLRLAPDEDSNAALWANFPPVYWDYKVARPKPAAQVLIDDRDSAHASPFGDMPVLASQQYGVGQVFYLGTDDLWRWRRNEGVDEYPRLWGQIVQGAALAHLLGASKRTQLSVDKEQYNVGDPVTVFARIYNERFQPISDAQIQAGFTVNTGTNSPLPEQTDLMLRAVPEQPGMYRGDFMAVKAGRYRLATYGDPDTAIEFNVTEPQFEIGDTAMNESLLKQMAAISGGRFFREEDLAGLVNFLDPAPETLHTARDVELWSCPFYFLLLCLVAVTEWILRRKWNLK